jgi:hypothetical protein
MTSLTAAAANSAANLAQVQEGFASSHELSPTEIWTIVAIAICVALMAVYAAIQRARRKKRVLPKGWSSIASPQAIWEILSRAVSRLANFTLELYKADHALVYKGTLDSIESDAFLVLSMASIPAAAEDFKDLPGVLHLNFRPAPKEYLEHYQFSTKIEECRLVKTSGGWREAQLVVPIPKILTSAQRRNYLRLEPQPPYEFGCELYQVPEDSIPDLASLEKVCAGQVMDISVGGAQIGLESSLSLKETQRFVCVTSLPVDENLGLELQNPTLVLLIQLMSQDFVEDLDTVGQKANSLLRIRFIGRYLRDPVKETSFVYRGLTQNSMEDLAHWMQAYQRFVIKKKKRLFSPVDGGQRPRNMFPSTPPKRPPLKDA